MVLFLNYFLFKPVMEIVERRNKTLKGLHTDAAKAANDADKAVKDYDERAADARRAMSGILVTARQNAAAEQERILKEARERYSGAVDEAMAKIRADVQSAEAGLKGETQKLSRAMASRIIGREVA